MTTTRTINVTLSLVLILTTMLATAWSALAVLPADPYADVVDPSTSPKVLGRDKALGAPDGKLATIVAVQKADLVLDLGEGEEGTGALTVHYGVTIAVNPTVEFLDDHHAVLVSQPVPLVPAGSTVTIAYPQAPLPYRYVRFVAAAEAYTIDAIVAATYRPDSDQDSLPDSWELQYGFDPLDPAGANGAAGDPDTDGLTNAEELTRGTNPTLSDTDADGLSDAQEVAAGTSPTTPDTDSDGLSDAHEVASGTNPASADTDGDQLSDAQEVAAGTSPTNPDTDGDGLSDRWETDHGLDPTDPTGTNGAQGDLDHDGVTNAQELTAGTSPNNPDTDGDGLSDGWEVQYGLNPLDPSGANGAQGDPDQDGYTNAQEAAAGTSPAIPDPHLIALPLITRT